MRTGERTRVKGWSPTGPPYDALRGWHGRTTRPGLHERPAPLLPPPRGTCLPLQLAQTRGVGGAFLASWALVPCQSSLSKKAVREEPSPSPSLARTPPSVPVCRSVPGVELSYLRRSRSLSVIARHKSASNTKKKPISHSLLLLLARLQSEPAARLLSVPDLTLKRPLRAIFS